MSKTLARGFHVIIHACILFYMLDAPGWAAYIGAFVIAHLMVPEERQ